MSNDAVTQYLNDRVSGLQGVVVALLSTLINKHAIEEESLITNLELWSALLAQNDDQREVFAEVISTLQGKGVWIPRVIEGGKSTSPDSEGDQDSE